MVKASNLRPVAAATALEEQTKFILGGGRGDRIRTCEPVAAATALREAAKFISASPSFEIPFSCDGCRASRKRFRMKQGPGNSMLCRFRFPSIMAAESIINVLARTDVATTSRLAPQNINMKHPEVARGESPQRVTGFEPATCRRGGRSRGAD